MLQGPETDREALARIRRHMAALLPVRQEVRNYTKEGVPFWTELNIVPVADAAGRYTHIVSVQRDTTERHAQLAALQESEQRYRLLFHANPQSMWVYDCETFAFLDVNAAAEAMYGYSRDEFLSRTVLDIRPPEEREHVRQAAARVPQGIARSGPWRHLRKDGRLLFVRIARRIRPRSRVVARGWCSRTTSPPRRNSKNNWCRPRRWRPWASWPAVSPTTSTISSR